MSQPMLYSAGDCAICGGAGSLFFVKSATSEKIFFFCPACGVAWESCPTPPRNVDTIDPLERFSPSRLIALPTKDEIFSAGLGHLIVNEYPYEDWGDSFFGEYLEKGMSSSS